MGDWWTPEGAEDGLERARAMHEDSVPRGRARRRLHRRAGVLAHPHRPRRACRSDPEPGVEIVESMGYEYWPQSLEAAIRHAIAVTGSPGLRHRERHRHDDDAPRIALRDRGARRASAAASPTGSTCAATSTGRCSTTSSGPRATAPVRARRRRPGDLRAHAQAQRRLARRHRPGQPARLTALGPPRQFPHTTLTFDPALGCDD